MFNNNYNELIDLSEQKLEYPIAILGLDKVGKTSLFQKITSAEQRNKNTIIQKPRKTSFSTNLPKTFKTSQKYKPTFGYEIKEITKEIILNNKKRKVNCILYDTAGNYKYKLLTKAHYDSFLAFIFVFDSNESESLDYIEKEIWLLEKKFRKKIIGIIVYNNYDESSTFLKEKKMKDVIDQKFRSFDKYDIYELSILGEKNGRLDFSMILENLCKKIYGFYGEKYLEDDFESDDGGGCY